MPTVEIIRANITDEERNKIFKRVEYLCGLMIAEMIEEGQNVIIVNQ